MKILKLTTLLVFFSLSTSTYARGIERCQEYQKQFDYLIGNNLDSAIVIAYEHKAFAIHAHSDSSYLKSAKNLMTAYVYKNNEDSVFHYYNFIKEHPKISKYSLTSQKATLALSAYYSNKFKADKAIVLLEELFNETSIEPNIYVKACVNIGTAYANKYDNQTCLKYLKKADSIALKNDITPAIKSELYSLFGLTCVNTSKFKDAITYNEKAITLKKEIDELILLPYLYNNIAYAANEIEDYRVAKNAIDSAFHYLPHLPNYEGAIYWSLGNYYQGKDQNAKAKDAFQKVLDYYKDVPDDFYKHNAIISLIFAKSKLRETTGYEPYLSMVSPELKKNMSIRDSLFLLNASLVEEIGKDDTNLAKKMNQSILLSNRYLTEVQESAIADQLEKYESEKKEQKIILLNKQNELEQAKATRNLLFLLISLLLGGIATIVFLREKKHNQTLSYKNKEVSDLNKEIEHRTANHLQTMMRLIESDIDNSKENAIQSVLLGQQHRLQVVSSIHAQLQRQGGAKNILLGKYLQDFCNYQEDFYLEQYDTLEINLNQHIREGYEIDALEATNIGLIVNELITNATKYAFVEQAHPQIDITLKEEGDNLVLSIKDNGIGIEPEKIRVGAKGLELVSDLVERMHGTIIKENADGLLYIISFRPKTFAYASN